MWGAPRWPPWWALVLRAAPWFWWWWRVRSPLLSAAHAPVAASSDAHTTAVAKRHRRPARSILQAVPDWWRGQSGSNAAAAFPAPSSAPFAPPPWSIVGPIAAAEYSLANKDSGRAARWSRPHSPTASKDGASNAQNGRNNTSLSVARTAGRLGAVKRRQNRMARHGIAMSRAAVAWELPLQTLPRPDDPSSQRLVPVTIFRPADDAPDAAPAETGASIAALTSAPADGTAAASTLPSATDSDDSASDCSSAYSAAEPMDLSLWAYAWGSATPLCEALVTPLQTLIRWARPDTDPQAAELASAEPSRAELSQPPTAVKASARVALAELLRGTGSADDGDVTLLSALTSLRGQCGVVEVGSGLGQLGITAASAGATAVLLTDVETAGVTMALQAWGETAGSVSSSPSRAADPSVSVEPADGFVQAAVAADTPALGAPAPLPSGAAVTVEGAMLDWTSPCDVRLCRPCTSSTSEALYAAIGGFTAALPGAAALVLGADVLYAPGSDVGVMETSAALLGHGGAMLVVDPGRALFDRCCEGVGLAAGDRGLAADGGGVGPGDAAAALEACGAGAASAGETSARLGDAGAVSNKEPSPTELYPVELSSVERATAVRRACDAAATGASEAAVKRELEGSGWALSSGFAGETSDRPWPQGFKLAGVASSAARDAFTELADDGKVTHTGWMACRSIEVSTPVSAAATPEVALPKFRCLLGVRMRRCPDADASVAHSGRAAALVSLAVDGAMSAVAVARAAGGGAVVAATARRADAGTGVASGLMGGAC